MRFYKLMGAGRLSEITAQEYAQALRKWIRMEAHQEMTAPMMGFNAPDGCAYLVLEDKNASNG